MPITQQNLNNRPCVQNNQPSFSGSFTQENPTELVKVFPVDSTSAGAVDIFGEFVKHCTVSNLAVTVSKPLKGQLMEIGGEADLSISNIQILATDLSSKATKVFQHYLNPEVSVNENTNRLVRSLMRVCPEHMDWKNLAEVLKTVKP